LEEIEAVTPLFECGVLNCIGDSTHCTKRGDTGEWTCPGTGSGESIPCDYVCDGYTIADCSNGADENVTFCASWYEGADEVAYSGYGSINDIFSGSASGLSNTCDESEFSCAGGIGTGCIPMHYVCDHYDDCDGGEDESVELCQNVTSLIGSGSVSSSGGCPLGHAECCSGGCILAQWIHDGDNDCGDYSDETYPTFQCDASTSTSLGGCALGYAECCNSGECISKTWIHDGDNDCGDKSDETYPPFQCDDLEVLDGISSGESFNGSSCADSVSTLFDAYDGSSLTFEDLADYGLCNDVEYPEYADKMQAECPAACGLCGGTTIVPHATGCDSGYVECCNTAWCIPERWVHDGDNDCGDMSDESELPFQCGEETQQSGNSGASHSGSNIIVQSGSGSSASHEGCEPGEVHCCTTEIRSCIPGSWVGDGDNDCGDNSDETSPPLQCSEEPQCLVDTEAYINNCCQGLCASNGYEGCWNCETKQSQDPVNYGGQHCFHPNACLFTTAFSGSGSQYSTVDSGYGSTPAAADDDAVEDCSEGEVKCCNIDLCIPHSWIHDGDNDCGDMSDENEPPLQCSSGSGKLASSSGSNIADAVECENGYVNVLLALLLILVNHFHNRQGSLSLSTPCVLTMIGSVPPYFLACVCICIQVCAVLHF
jgi:hypothetical protein